MRRRHAPRYRCEHPGCTEWALFEVATRREALELDRRYAGKWRCLRHTRMEEWLTADNRIREVTLTVEQLPYGRFWRELHNGYASGPGFNAYAEEFPPGTQIIVTARLLLPAPAPAGKETP